MGFELWEGSSFFSVSLPCGLMFSFGETLPSFGSSSSPKQNLMHLQVRHV